MGGYGSGSWYRWNKKATVEDVQARRELSAPKGDAEAGKSRRLTWSQLGEEVGSSGVVGWGDRITLRYTCAGEERIAQDVALTHTRCQYGGERPWFVFPGCAKRVGTLFGGRTFACRTCYNLAYYSQRCDTLDRVIHRMHKLERKLERPGLHRKTVLRVNAELNRLDQRFADGMLRRFGEAELLEATHSGPSSGRFGVGTDLGTSAH